MRKACTWLLELQGTDINRLTVIATRFELVSFSLSMKGAMPVIQFFVVERAVQPSQCHHRTPYFKLM